MHPVRMMRSLFIIAISIVTICVVVPSSALRDTTNSNVNVKSTFANPQLCDAKLTRKSCQQLALEAPIAIEGMEASLSLASMGMQYGSGFDMFMSALAASSEIEANPYLELDFDILAESFSTFKNFFSQKMSSFAKHLKLSFDKLDEKILEAGGYSTLGLEEPAL